MNLAHKSYLRALSALLALMCAPATVHALYRGDEFTIRSYEVGAMYFINRITYEPWTEQMDRFAASTNAFIGAAGSLRGDDLYLYQNLKLYQPVGDTLGIRIGYLQDRDFDGSYRRFQMGLAWHVSPRWMLELVGEPRPDKEDSDIGLAVEYRARRLAGRVQVLYPNFVYNSKNPDDATLQRVANLQFDIQYQPLPEWTFYVAGDLDPPRTLVNPADSFRFDFEKYIGEIGFRHRHDGGQWWGAIEGEYTRKLREGLEPEDVNAFSEDRNYVQGRIEYLRYLDADTHLRMGALYVFFDEDRLFPFFPENDLLTDRQDRIVYAGRSWSLRDRVQLNTLLLLNGLDHRRERAEDEDSGRDRPFHVRTAASLIFNGPDYQLETGAALNLDQTRFGGGFVKVFAAF